MQKLQKKVALKGLSKHPISAFKAGSLMAGLKMQHRPPYPFWSHVVLSLKELTNTQAISIFNKIIN